MVSGWFVCNGLVRFGIWVAWVALGWLCLLDGWFGWRWADFWVVHLAGSRWYLGLVWCKGKELG